MPTWACRFEAHVAGDLQIAEGRTRLAACRKPVTPPHLSVALICRQSTASASMSRAESASVQLNTQAATSGRRSRPGSAPGPGRDLGRTPALRTR